MKINTGLTRDTDIGLKLVNYSVWFQIVLCKCDI